MVGLPAFIVGEANPVLPNPGNYLNLRAPNGEFELVLIGTRGSKLVECRLRNFCRLDTTGMRFDLSKHVGQFGR